MGHGECKLCVVCAMNFSRYGKEIEENLIRMIWMKQINCFGLGVEPLADSVEAFVMELQIR